MPTRINHRAFVAAAACSCALIACGLQFGATAPTAPAAIPTYTPAAATGAGPTSQPSATSSAAEVTETPAASPTAEVTSTPSGSLTGTIAQQANCRYGPGAYYLYKIGMRAGAPIEIKGRTIDGGWAYIQFKGTHNLCWINSKLIQVDGDLMTVPDAYPDNSSLPRATKYGPVAITDVSGSGASVTVSWAPIVLPANAQISDIEREYIVEVWTCVNGVPGFYSLGTNDTEMTFEVDDSCGQSSRADIVAQNKAGVSGVTQIALP